MYISRVQRQTPDLRLWEPFDEGDLEKTFRLHGIDYAWVYVAPKAFTREAPDFKTAVDGTFGGKIKLLGYEAKVVQDKAELNLVWKILDSMDEDYSVSIRLLDEAGHQWVQQDGRPLNGKLQTSHIPAEKRGYFMRDMHELALPPGMPAGTYQLRIYSYSADSGATLPATDAVGKTSFAGLQAGSLALPKQGGKPTDFEPEYYVDTGMGDGVRLIGYDLPSAEVQPGETVSPVLYWQAMDTIQEDRLVRLSLAVKGKPITVDQPPAGSDYPTSQWSLGDVVKGWLDLLIPPDTPSGTYGLSIVLLEPDGSHISEPVSLGESRVEGRPRQFEVPDDIQHPLEANFDNQVEWLGYDLDVQTEETENPQVNVTLYWRALSRLPVDYKVFTQLFGPDGEMYGQKDDFPGGGTLPTASWLEGEIVTDLYEISLDPETPHGIYSMSIGFYDPNTGERLPVVDTQGRTIADHVLIPQVRLE